MTQHPFTNDLANETSPYLLQHAHNPVNWMPWGDAAWEKAKKEDKLVIVSIGYSACHWCHVMEHESFEDEAVAKIMNDHFISIKVDREERPDVDQIYMDAVQIITGQGGWPLNAICLPDGRPVYAGTYFQREHWKQLLAYMDNHFKNHRDELLEQAAEITRGIHVMDKIPKAVDTTFTEADREAMFSKINSYWDHERGGRRGAPKFPMPVTISYLLRNYFYTRNIKALQAVTITLDNMAAGGIYDHVGGGFARYSVDDSWTIPHFEKMLYDNAQLVSLYAEAYQTTKNDRYKQVVYETLEFIARELTDPSGGFYSALDADSEGEEGKYYVWTFDELKQLLGEGFEQFCSFYDISPQGNFEHGTINLRLKAGVASDLSPVAPQLKKLFEQRSHRIRPGLDDKILTSWNALMLKGYVDAYRAFGEERFLRAAIENANFLRKNCIKPDYSMTRNHKQGRSTISGFLDDYALTIDSFITLYQVTFDERWLTDARSLADHVIQHFYAADRGIFYYTSINDAPLIARKTETSDNVIPSSNAVMAKVLHLLGHYFESDTYLKISKQQVMNMKEYALSHTAFYAQWAMLTDWFISPLNEVAIVGSDAIALRKKFDAHFLPNCIWLGTQTSSELPLLVDKKMNTSTLLYVCKNKTCSLPMVDFETVLPMLQAR